MKQHLDLLKQLAIANQARCPHYGMGSVTEVSIEFNAIQLAGETGELLNLIKKKLRGDLVVSGPQLINDALADELADVVICCDLLAQRLGISLHAAIIHKFNETSEKIGSKVTIK